MLEREKITTSRNDFIAHAIETAEAIDPFEFWQRGETITWGITKKFGYGRSLIVEAAIKTWLDGHDPKDLYDQKPVDYMFLESAAGEAFHRYKKIEGTCQGHPVCFAFDRVTKPKNSNSLLSAFWHHAGHKIQNGAIFFAGFGENNETTTPTISTHMSRTDKSWDQMKYTNINHPHDDLNWEYEVTVLQHPILHAE